jgi:creatinine amidohydrolase
MVLTGHAGGQHMSALKEACQNSVAKTGKRVSLVSLFDLIEMSAAETPHDGHSGEIETSLMMVIREDLVRGKPAANFPERPRFLILNDVRHLMGNGIMGDPTKASEDKGKTFFEMESQESWKLWLSLSPIQRGDTGPCAISLYAL